MHRIASAVALAGLLIAGLVALVASPAAAHEQRKVGSLQFTVGWKVEPAYTGQLNAVQVFVHDGAGNPIDDLGSPTTLKVTAATGSLTSGPLDLEPSFDPDTGLGTHGEFDAALIPTRAGDYTFNFTGTVSGQQINEKFTSGPNTFATVEDPAPVEFPDKNPSLSDLNTLTGRVSARAGTAVTKANSASSSATTADVLGGIALVLGVVALVVSIPRRRRPAAA